MYALLVLFQQLNSAKPLNVKVLLLVSNKFQAVLRKGNICGSLNTNTQILAMRVKVRAIISMYILELLAIIVYFHTNLLPCCCTTCWLVLHVFGAHNTTKKKKKVKVYSTFFFIRKTRLFTYLQIKLDFVKESVTHLDMQTFKC